MLGMELGEMSNREQSSKGEGVGNNREKGSWVLFHVLLLAGGSSVCVTSCIYDKHGTGNLQNPIFHVLALRNDSSQKKDLKNKYLPR